MISERKFAEKFTSFWNDTLPRGAAVSRHINLQVNRFAKPLQSEIPGSRRALVNELGFRLFVERIRDGQVMATAPELALAIEIGRTVAQFLSIEMTSPPSDDVWDPNTVEIEEAMILAHRLARFFLRYEAKASILPEPHFAGCGLLESCQGDILAGSTLYEVKSGEASFRLADLRQVLSYCALNHAGRFYSITSVGFINPRLGIYSIVDIDALARSAAGISADRLLFDITHFLVSQSASL